LVHRLEAHWLHFRSAGGRALARPRGPALGRIRGQTAFMRPRRALAPTRRPPTGRHDGAGPRPTARRLRRLRPPRAPHAAAHQPRTWQGARKKRDIETEKPWARQVDSIHAGTPFNSALISAARVSAWNTPWHKPATSPLGRSSWRRTARRASGSRSRPKAAARASNIAAVWSSSGTFWPAR